MMHAVLMIASMMLFCASEASVAQDFGHYEGRLVLNASGGDGRNMTLVEPFTYIDPQTQAWPVPAGAITDGASVPSFFWFYYAPFTGKYRDAAAIHDYYCVTHSMSWSATHLMFYNAMRAAGVGEKDAKMMYAAVYYFGPRWGVGSASRGPGAKRAETRDEQKKLFEPYRQMIEQNNPSIDRIEESIDNAE